MTWIAVAFVGGFVAGACVCVAALRTDRKVVDRSRRELAKEWVDYWKRKEIWDDFRKRQALRTKPVGVA